MSHAKLLLPGTKRLQGVEALVSTIISMLDDDGFDEFDIDWEDETLNPLTAEY